jgi:hypothetical protein
VTGTRVPPPHERPVPIGCRVIDQTLGGLVPGGLTLVTADRDVRAAIAAQLIRRVARAGSLVVLASQNDTTGELMRRIRTAGESTVIVAPGPPVDLDRLGRHIPRVRHVVVWDADGDAAALRSWRVLAARLAVPALVCMSGSRPAEADARDSRLECFQTHAGPFARFVARGVPAFGAEPHRIAIGVDAESLRVLSGKTLFVRVRGTRWAPERDFDGLLHSRPTVMTSATLAARLGEPVWTPVDDLEAAVTLEALAAAVVIRSNAPRSRSAGRPTATRSARTSCGGRRDRARWNLPRRRPHAIARAGCHRSARPRLAARDTRLASSRFETRVGQNTK